MEKLRTYLNGLTKEQRGALCSACKTTEGYLRKAISSDQKLGGDLCIAIERESGRRVLCEDLRPDMDWAFIRQTDATPVADSVGQPEDRRSGEERRADEDRRSHEERRQIESSGQLFPSEE
jgi:DNA-binding transcriptional regulator YdaS (Cro superfamily)